MRWMAVLQRRATKTSSGLQRSGVDPPLGSSRACLTAFIAFSVPLVSASPVRRPIWLVASPVPPPETISGGVGGGGDD